MTMDKDIKDRWVRALRSGVYEQGEAVLYSVEKHLFCCLGVLCVVAGAEPEQIAGESFHDPDWLEAVGADRAEQIKPTSESHFWRLAHMNDEGKSFAVLADYIEANL
jgi:hypothetical protein